MIPSSFTSNSLVSQVKVEVIAGLSAADSEPETNLHLKVLIALITRNAIRLNTSDCIRLFEALETAALHSAELVVYTALVLMSLTEDYSSIIAVQKVIGVLETSSAGRRALFIHRHLQTPDLLSTMCESFGFIIEVPLDYLHRSRLSLVNLTRVIELDPEELDVTALAVQMLSSNSLSIVSLLQCMDTVASSLFKSLVALAAAQNCRLPDNSLLALKRPWRTLYFCLAYNSQNSDIYSIFFLNHFDIRAALKQAEPDLQQQLLTAANQHLPWFFMPSYFQTAPQPLKERLPYTITDEYSEALWMRHLHYSPLTTVLKTLPVRTNSESEALNPLRVFTFFSLTSSIEAT
jgi:hypothetical protein